MAGPQPIPDPVTPARVVSYQTYLSSASWSKLRASAIERDGGRCRLCDVPDELTVHHRRYPRVWSEDCLDNLTTLCRRCHRLAEEGSRSERYKARPVLVVLSRFERIG